VSTLKKALKLFQIFLDRKSALSVSELAGLSGLSINAIYRITSTLLEEGYLTQQNKRGKYMPGPKLLEFGSLASELLNIEDLSRPYINDLSNLIGESVQLATLDGEKVVVLASITGKQTLRIVVEEKADLPAHCTGEGKTLLANLNEVELERYFARTPKMNEYTCNTIVDKDMLKKQLATIKQKGIAVEKAEYASGIVDIAVPVKNGIGRVVAALGVPIPEPRANDSRVTELIPLIRDSAAKISKTLGYYESKV
jgi:IclR family transcriptional regulator, KDG regulon repressor